ncbi:MAG: hypothetical protein DME25_09995, partial [Verrucomicrobia bacterium]
MRPISLLKLLAALAVCLKGLAAEAPATFKAGEFTFARPADWQWIDTTSSMRKAQLKITDTEHKESADDMFFHFGAGGGGGIQANIDRWLGQF